MTKIIPTVGRIVWFTPSILAGETGFAHHDALKPLAAIVAHVWGPAMVNLTVLDSNGVTHSRTSVQLVQADEPKPESGYFCSWMPYQVGQAKAHEPKSLTTAAGHPITQAQMDAGMSGNNSSGLGFGAAVAYLRAGKRVSRSGWNGKGMWLALQVPDANSKMSLPYIYMKTADDKQVPWLASQTDVLADDWSVAA